MLTIDGSFGEGGGQMLRSSLALSLVTGKPFAIGRIRASRKKPGLMRQHLAPVRAAAEVGRAEVEGAEIGSKRLTFCPTSVTAGRYTFDVGSAGSATLVLQTVLPISSATAAETDWYRSDSTWKSRRLADWAAAYIGAYYSCYIGQPSTP